MSSALVLVAIPKKKRNAIINDNLEQHAVDRKAQPYNVTEKKIQGRKLYLAEKEKLYFEHPDDDNNDVIIVGAHINNKFAKYIEHQDKMYFIDDKNIVYSKKYKIVGKYVNQKIILTK